MCGIGRVQECSRINGTIIPKRGPAFRVAPAVRLLHPKTVGALLSGFGGRSHERSNPTAVQALVR